MHLSFYGPGLGVHSAGGPLRHVMRFSRWLWSAVGAGLVIAGAAAAWAGTFELRADVITTEAKTQTIVARGRVRITDGVSIARAGSAVYAAGEGRLVLTEGVTVMTPEGDLQARQATVLLGKGRVFERVEAVGAVRVEVQRRVLKADRVSYAVSTGHVMAEGNVKLFAPPDLLATGGELLADPRHGVAVLSGRPRVQNKDGFIEGDRLEVQARTQTAFIRGHVVAVVGSTRITADAATLRAEEQKVIFSDRVTMTEPRRTVTADQVTVYYQQRRIVAEGTTSIRVEESR